jgi:hypothetical protein
VYAFSLSSLVLIDFGHNPSGSNSSSILYVIGALSVVAVLSIVLNLIVQRYSSKFTFLSANIHLMIHRLSTNLPLHVVVLMAFQFLIYFLVGVEPTPRPSFGLVPVEHSFTVASPLETFERNTIEVPARTASPGIGEFGESRDNALVDRHSSLLNAKDGYTVVQAAIGVAGALSGPVGAVLSAAAEVGIQMVKDRTGDSK